MAQHAAPDGGPLGPYAISILRTLVPVIWGHAIAYAVSFGIPASILDQYQAVITEALAALLTVGWYALWRWIETKLPSVDTDVVHLLALLALGHPAQPSYTTTPVVTLTGTVGPSGVTTTPPTT
jgi:hypothetical protein